jgi:membrane protein
LTVLLGTALPTLLTAIAFALIYVAVPNRCVRITDALAAIPVFLIWLFLSWNVILTGTVIAAALPDWRRSEHERVTGPGGRLALAMDILAALYAVAATGVGLTQRSLRLAVDVREAALIPVLDELRNGDFTAIGNDNVWRLGRDLSRTPVSELVHLMGYGVPMAPDITGRSDSVSRLGAVLADAQATEKQTLGQPVSALFKTQREEIKQGPRAVPD